MEALKSQKDVAEMLEVTRKTVRLWCKQGLPSYKPSHEVVLIDLNELKSWLLNHSSEKVRQHAKKLN
ncbi:helix-turn-helix domain-containing protein [Brevibacillus invocatus]|uniref:helix-turn-helix domain-containing protein n=1 Tax=Brevibacillus invocatus TaxID=173959 RepID=UPI00203EADA0|nr:helix-turn-helix domain-containing protein [Brevibacillus invocatus]MCM3078494.1 helix-turn-helix domain-containing protein [Brevibacillus invocatus]MCM3430928.1 helix-turn-helix domain-containing protein [Brevibacillus invocatus]